MATLVAILFCDNIAIGLGCLCHIYRMGDISNAYTLSLRFRPAACCDFDGAGFYLILPLCAQKNSN